MPYGPMPRLCMNPLGGPWGSFAWRYPKSSFDPNGRPFRHRLHLRQGRLHRCPHQRSSKLSKVCLWSRSPTPELRGASPPLNSFSSSFSFPPKFLPLNQSSWDAYLGLDPPQLTALSPPVAASGWKHQTRRTLRNDPRKPEPTLGRNTGLRTGPPIPGCPPWA